MKALVSAVEAATNATLAADVATAWKPWGECYSCNRPLGAKRRQVKYDTYALVIPTDTNDDPQQSAGMLALMPRHETCKRKKNIAATSIVTNQGTLRYSAETVPVQTGGQPALMPVVYLNPSGDRIIVTRHGDQGPATLLDAWRDSGLVPAGQARVGHATPGAHVLARPGGFSITTSTESWDINCDDSFSEGIGACGGLLLVVSYHHDVANVGSDLDTNNALHFDTDKVVHGWVPLLRQP